MKITIVTTMRNEGPHLLEWVAHHRAAGVTGFLVYVNDCEDGTEALLDLLPDVVCIHQEDGPKTPQWRALKAAWGHELVQQADWLCCIDCDEFINLGNGLSDIPQLIERVGGDAILLPWRLFGHAGQAELSELPTTERFDRAAPSDLLYPAVAAFFKTLFRREGPFRQFGVHRPRQKNAENHGVPIIHDGSGTRLRGVLAEDDGRIMNWGAPIARDLVQLNHYSLRSAADFMLKQLRGLPNRQGKALDLSYWAERNFNTVEEKTIAHMRAATKIEEEKLLALPGVAQALGQCRGWHKRRFAALMQQEAAVKFYGRLLLSAGSTPLPDTEAKALIRTYQKALGHG